MGIGLSKYAIGEARTVEVENAGTVQLMVNDDILSDNSGSFEVNIRLIAPPQGISQTLILPLPEGTYRSAQGFKGTAYDPNLYHLGKDYCVEASTDKMGVKLSGTRFYAIGRGTVVDVRFSEPAQRRDGVGNYITIDHGNRLVAVYMHLAKVFVKPGQGVDSRTPLGEAGDVILHPRPNCGHLHLEIRSNGVTSLNVPPNLRYSYASKDGKTRYSRALANEGAVNTWIDSNFFDPDRILTTRRANDISPTIDNENPVRTTVIPANAGWVNTGIGVESGKLLGFEASGLVNTAGGSPNTGPNGFAPAICDKPNCAGRGEPYGSLLGRIGDGNPFRVGETSEFTARSSGKLYLAVNDNDIYYSDNKGNFTVQITKLPSSDSQDLSLARSTKPKVITKRVEVPANKMWSDSGIPFIAGDAITVEASGEVNGSLRNNEANKWVGPDGWSRPPIMPSYSKAAWVLGRGSSYMCLTGKVGQNGKPFKVGSNYSFVAHSSGILFLGINDEVIDENGNIVSDEGLGWKDNAGSFSVQINIGR